MQIDLLSAVKEIASAANISIKLLNSDSTDFSSIDLDMRKQLFFENNYTRIYNDIMKTGEPATLYFTKDCFLVEYAFCQLPSSEFYDILLIGPYLIAPVTEDMIHLFIQKQELPPVAFQMIHDYYQTVPIVQDISFFLNVLMNMLKKMYEPNETFKVKHLTGTDSILNSPLLKNLDHSSLYMLDDNVKASVLEQRYLAENNLLESITNGDLEGAMKAVNEFLKFRIEPRTKDSLRDKKNNLIISNTLFRKSVEISSVHPMHIDSMSRKFAIRIESIYSEQDATQLISDMIRHYCMLVKNYSLKGYSFLIRSVLSYIDLHIEETLALQNLASEFSVNSSHLSTLFKKETGMNLTAYIHERRMNRGILLLNTTNDSISDIAVACGIPDINYFTKLFKKYHKKTPSEYRKFIKHR